MDAFELLKNDHEKVSKLFKEAEAASGQAKRTIFNQIKSELDLHAEVEEKIFYPALENKPESRDITLEAYEEHSVVKELLAELAAADSINDEWTAKFTVLRENVEHHVEEEEGELFDKAEDVLSQEQIEALGDEMAAAKQRAQGGRPSATKPAQAAKARAAKASSSSSDKGIIGTLKSLVGLGDSSDESTSTRSRSANRRSTSKKSSKQSGRSAKKASSRKAPAKRAASKKSSKKTSSSRSSGRRSSASRASALKISRRVGTKKRSNTGSTKRSGKTTTKRTGSRRRSR